MKTRKRRRSTKKQTRRRGKIGKKFKKYDELSPFELKNIFFAASKHEKNLKKILKKSCFQLNAEKKKFSQLTKALSTFFSAEKVAKKF